MSSVPPPPDHGPRHDRRRRVWLFVALGVLIVLIAVRAALPVVVKRVVNDKLSQLEGYSGSLADIDISLWRGAYQIEGLRIMKTNGKVPVPFVEADVIDLSVQWKALLHGSIVAEIELYSPKVNMVNSKNPAERQTGAQKSKETAKKSSEGDKNWTDTVRSLTPFEINRVAIHDGQIHYRDLESKPRVDVFIKQLEATARNLTNTEKAGETKYATVEASAVAMGSGKVRLDGHIDPWADQPTFDLKFRLDGLQLKQLNDFLQAYANVDAEKGTFSLDAEFVANGGRFRGYAKPFVKDLQILKWGDEKESFFGKLWEGAVQVVADIFTNQKKDQMATRIPFNGSFDKPSPDLLATIGGILQNAFLQSLRRGLEGSVKIGGKMGEGEKG